MKITLQRTTVFLFVNGSRLSEIKEFRAGPFFTHPKISPSNNLTKNTRNRSNLAARLDNQLLSVRNT